MRSKEVKHMYFEYGNEELAVLRRDKRMCEVIDRVGHIYREVDGDIFSSVVHHIIGQQISTKAQATVWQRMRDGLGEVNAETILAAGVPRLQSMGMTYRKAEYITDFAERVSRGEFDPDAVNGMSDDEAIRALSALAICECAANCVRHADGTELYVRFWRKPGCTEVALTNNGAAPKEKITEGGGLSMLRQRIKEADGKMEVQSIPRFKLMLSLPEQEEAVYESDDR